MALNLCKILSTGGLGGLDPSVQVGRKPYATSLGCFSPDFYPFIYWFFKGVCVGGEGEKVRLWLLFFFKDFIYLFLERREEREREREGNIWFGCLLNAPWLGTEPATWACTLTGNWTHYLSLCETMPSQLSHPSQGPGSSLPPQLGRGEPPPVCLCFLLPFLWNTFFHPFAPGLCVFLKLKWVCCRQHSIGPCLSFIHLPIQSF